VVHFERPPTSAGEIYADANESLSKKIFLLSGVLIYEKIDTYFHEFFGVILT